MDEYRCAACGEFLEVTPDPLRPWAKSVPVCECQEELLAKAEAYEYETLEKIDGYESAEEEAKDLLFAMERKLSNLLGVPGESRPMTRYALSLLEDPEDLLARVTQYIEDYFEDS